MKNKLGKKIILACKILHGGSPKGGVEKKN